MIISWDFFNTRKTMRNNLDKNECEILSPRVRSKVLLISWNTKYWPNATWILTQCNMSTDTMQHEYWPNATWICTNHLSVSHLLPKWLQQSYLGKITSVAILIVDSPFDKLLYLINTLKTFCVSDCCEQMLNKTLTD